MDTGLVITLVVILALILILLAVVVPRVQRGREEAGRGA